MGVQGGYRLLFITLASVGAWIAASATGLTGHFTQQSVRSVLVDRGLWAVIAFCTVFAAGQLLRVPSPIFIAAAVAVYGRTAGALIALAGALASATVSFAVVRALAGHALADVELPLVHRVLRHLNRHPIMTVALLRLVFQSAPPLNYALAMTAIHWRDHLLGSLLGLPTPVIAMAFLIDWLLGRAS